MRAFWRKLTSERVIYTNVVGEAARSLKSRRMQAILSGFGIMTGIAAVVLLVAIVSGIHRYAVENIGAAGGNIIQVFTGFDMSSRDPRGYPVSLRLDDMEAVLRASPYFDLASATNGANAPIRLPRRVLRDLSITGITDDGFAMQQLALAGGRLFLPNESFGGDRVAVLGAAVAREMAMPSGGIGEPLVIGDWTFRIVGTLAWVGDPDSSFRYGSDWTVYIPFRACAAAFTGNDKAGSIRFRLKDPDTDQIAIADATVVLNRRKIMRGETSGSYQFSNAVERMDQLTKILTGLKLLVGVVGGIGLFVGAVGVANVLLVSVRERTQEIGVRRAIGATKRAVFVGFLLEALAITLSGGIAGIVIAYLLTKIALFIPSIPIGARPHISLFTCVTAVGLLTAVGLVAGVGPARRAAAVYPSEALRAE